MSADTSNAWDKLLLQSQMKNIRIETKWDQRRQSAITQIYNVKNKITTVYIQFTNILSS